MGMEFIPFIVSASLGALIGLERQWEDQQRTDSEVSDRSVGLRTFVLFALLGTTAALIDREYSAGFFPIGFALFCLLLAGWSFLPNPARATSGLTTLSAAMMTFLIGALALWENHRLATVLAVTTLLLLGYKRSIHKLSRSFTREDVHSALVFAAITGVILPLAPNKGYGPYEAFNPFQIWLMVVLVAGLGFFGYVAMRWLGPRAGLGSMGILGGLASSTVTSLAFSKQSRERPELSGSFAMAVILACTIMLGRVAILVYMFDRDLMKTLVPWLLLMCLPGVAYTVWHLLRGKRGREPHDVPPLSNPLSIGTGIKFALIYAFVVLFARAGEDLFGTTGVHVVALLSGLTDMDAIALSLSRSSAAGDLDKSTAVAAILLAAASNTLLKGGFALAYGSPELRKRILIVFSATIALGVAGWFIAR
jgi:uncharacterized membrane protein (DUF4010 family)